MNGSPLARGPDLQYVAISQGLVQHAWSGPVCFAASKDQNVV